MGLFSVGVVCHIFGGIPVVSVFVVQYGCKNTVIDGVGVYLWVE